MLHSTFPELQGTQTDQGTQAGCCDDLALGRSKHRERVEGSRGLAMRQSTLGKGMCYPQQGLM